MFGIFIVLWHLVTSFGIFGCLFGFLAVFRHFKLSWLGLLYKLIVLSVCVDVSVCVFLDVNQDGIP